MNKKLIFIFLLLLSASMAYDCVPLTFWSLSRLAGREIPYDTFEKAILKGKKSAPLLSEALEDGKSIIKDIKFVNIYSVVNGSVVENRGIKFNIPYLYIGQAPKELIVNNNSDSNSHAALVFFSQNSVKIFNTIDINKSYIETISYDDFFSRVYIVYEIDCNSIILWRNPTEIGAN